MANEKISQMPAATTLTGTELIELVQSGTNVGGTVSQLTPFLGSSPVIGGGSTSALGTFGVHVSWLNLWPNAGTPATPWGSSNIEATNTGPGIWTASTTGGSAGAIQPFNGAGSNLAASCQMCTMTSGAAANSGATIAGVGGIMGISGAQNVPMARLLSSGFPVSGFTMVLYFALNATVNTEQLFFGYYGAGSAAITGSTVPSSLLNSIALGRDAGDTNLQFMINNAAGTAAKTDLGVTHTSVANQMLRLVITCDGFGNCTITLSNLEAGGGQIATASYPTATAKLPAAQAGAGSSIAPLFFVNNGGSATNVGWAYLYASLTVGPGS